jgi:hypothetical protein
MKIHLRQLPAGLVISRFDNNWFVVSGEKGVGKMVYRGFFKAEAFDQGVHETCLLLKNYGNDLYILSMLLSLFNVYIPHKSWRAKSFITHETPLAALRNALKNQ